MPGIVINPLAFDRHQNYREAVDLCNSFLIANEITLPRYSTDSFFMPYGPGSFGYYRQGIVSVNVLRTAVPPKSPGYQWSYTGWKADRTAAGVTAHEVGHHVDWFHKNISSRLRVENISGYSKNNDVESFAEAMRLFILNPDLLRRAWPETFFSLETVFTPVVDLTWREVLVNANPRYITAAERRIAKA